MPNKDAYTENNEAGRNRELKNRAFITKIEEKYNTV